MSDPTLRVPSNEVKTFWNIDQSTGFWAGSFIGDFFSPLTSIIMTIGGAIVGGQIGKSRIEREHKEGRLVSPPSFLNKHLIIGLGIGRMLGELAGWLTTATWGGSVPSLLVIGTVAGGVFGAYKGQKRQEKEYAQAQAYVREYGEFVPTYARGQSPVMQPCKENAVSLQEAAQLDARLQANALSFTQTLENQPEVTRQR